jgi:hypothetical protein
MRHDPGSALPYLTSEPLVLWPARAALACSPFP